MQKGGKISSMQLSPCIMDQDMMNQYLVSLKIFILERDFCTFYISKYVLLGAWYRIWERRGAQIEKRFLLFEKRRIFRRIERVFAIRLSSINKNKHRLIKEGLYKRSPVEKIA